MLLYRTAARSAMQSRVRVHVTRVRARAAELALFKLLKLWISGRGAFDDRFQ